MKKRIPLAVLTAIQPLIDKNKGLVKPVNDESVCFHLIDIDSESDFFFKLHHQKDNKHYVQMKPHSPSTIEQGAWTLEIKDIPNLFNSWIDILSKYNSTHTIFDDPIIESYYNELEPDFEILDADADTAPFNNRQQQYIRGIYDNLIEQIINEQSEENKYEAEFIITKIKVAQKELSKSTKRQVIDSLRKVSAFCMKYSYKISISLAAEALLKLGEMAIKSLGY